MPWWRAASRLASAATVILGGLLLAVLMPLVGAAGRRWVVRSWFRTVLRAFGVRMVQHGDATFTDPASADAGLGTMIVTNHTSWLDVVVLNAIQPCRMVAKSEIRSWFVIGPLTTAAGTVYLERNRLSTLPDTVAALTRTLQGGASVGVFPEGTTWCGMASGRYRPATFAAAVAAGSGVRPVAVRYRVGPELPTTAAAFVGEQTLWNSLVRVAAAKDLTLHVDVLPVQHADPSLDARRARRELACRSHVAVAGVTELAELAQLPHPAPGQDRPVEA